MSGRRDTLGPTGMTSAPATGPRTFWEVAFIITVCDSQWQTSEGTGLAGKSLLALALWTFTATGTHNRALQATAYITFASF